MSKLGALFVMSNIDRPNRRGRPDLLLMALLALTCSSPDPQTSFVSDLDTTKMEPQVRRYLEEARAEVLKSPRSALAWGRFGMVTHAHELWAEAAQAYQRARALDPSDVRWPYYFGDVLSIVGTDLAQAEEAFRTVLKLRPGYAPAHLRLGNILLARDHAQLAARQFEQALELEPNLQPARVALAQVRLSAGQLEVAEELLTGVLTDAPRHAQALSALGQVYLRQGRRSEAREIAERARGAARYNLYSDPLMGEVDNQGRSALVLWERAKAFLENGNSEEAAKGLRLVVELQPSNADAHQQLGIAYGNLANMDKSLHHLQLAVALDPEWLEPRLQLAAVYLESDNAAKAIPQLLKALELMPDHPDAGWLLGRAQLLMGDLDGSLRSFEEARRRGVAVPVWAHSEWGSALAQSGRISEAGDHFAAALSQEPENPQALFYLGLLLEGGGRIEEALAYYCKSLRAEPMPPARARLQALGRHCDT